jgi:wyosine [tRNA(Phe)-imidazoG37] synthetase (radical SAM superfamily)
MSSPVFGPVPSRRLGHSLGINNIPPKICSYSCVYCQIGKTTSMQVERRSFYEPEKIAQSVETKIRQTAERSEPVDYLTFVSDGEPSLDGNLGREIELLRSFGIKIAVITNASLLWIEDVRHDLSQADWVSLKVDAVSEDVWRRTDRPHKRLDLGEILNGMLAFSKVFQGELVTETMLVQDFNDDEHEIGKIAEFLYTLKPEKAYVAVPTRPPAMDIVQGVGEEVLNRAYQLFAAKLGIVEYLIGYEGNEFASTGDVEADLLDITSVHPMREDAVKAMLGKARKGWDTIEELLRKGVLVEMEYEGKKFYMRKLPGYKRSTL